MLGVTRNSFPLFSMHRTRGCFPLELSRQIAAISVAMETIVSANSSAKSACSICLGLFLVVWIE